MMSLAVTVPPGLLMRTISPRGREAVLVDPVQLEAHLLHRARDRLPGDQAAHGGFPRDDPVDAEQVDDRLHFPGDLVVPERLLAVERDGDAAREQDERDKRGDPCHNSWDRGCAAGVAGSW